MLYYRVKPEADQKRRNDGSIYIANELYTPTEAEIFANRNYLTIIDKRMTETF